MGDFLSPTPVSLTSQDFDPSVMAPSTPKAKPPKAAPEKTATVKPVADVTPPAPAPSGGGMDATLKSIGDLERQRADYMPPKMQMPEKPKTANDDIQLWGSLAIAFAGLASLRTRTPMTTALNAAAAALTGMREGKKERADQAYHEWQENTRIALETQAHEQRAYEEMMNNITHREELNLRLGEVGQTEKYREDDMRMRVWTQISQDPLMEQERQRGMAEGGVPKAVEHMSGLQTARQQQAEKVREAGKGVVAAKFDQEIIDEMKQSPEWQQADAAGDHPTKLRMMLDIESKLKNKASLAQRWPQEFIDSMAKDIGEGRKAPFTNTNLSGRAGTGNPNTIAVMERLHELYPNYDSVDWRAKQQAVTQLQGKDGDQIRSFTVLLHHLEFFDSLAKAMEGQDTRLQNKITNEIATQFGMPQVTNFDMAKQVVGDEMMKAIIGAGGGQGDREAMQKVMDAAGSPEQLKGISESARTLAQGQLAGQLSKYRHLLKIGWLTPEDIIPEKTIKAFGGSVTDPDKMVNPGGKNIADRFDVEDSGVSMPKPNLEKVSDEKKDPVSVDDALKHGQSKGATATYLRKDGTYGYKFPDKPGWYDADGKRIPGS